MKSKTLRAMLGGSVAAVMALSISLPLQANAATEIQTVTLKTDNFAQFMEYLQQYSTNGFSFEGSTVTITKPVVTTKPAATPAPTAKPAATPAPTAKPVATPAPTVKPAAPVATAKPAATPAAQAVSDATGTAAFTQQIVTLVNKERAAAGLSPVSALASLNKVAAAKATDMRANNYFSHTSPTYGSPFDMMSAFGVTYQYAGENIAMGQRTPQEVMTAWMNSAGHRANILSANFNYIGVGFDNNYWVQEFIGK
ncbi:CAP domain-containing protein [Paenibacillus graminis]|uniref:CAP domain-containing protein n=1 Tax=Paenibacillus graminis TaxID=189425 RepID=UPI000FA4AB9A|nr:CAP domain-containing protein [Paenibacillus graminis]MEC0171966.1 CAP domain-containing protein [Paenibacillus graminis]